VLEVSDEVEVEDEEGVTDDDTSLLSDDEVSIDEVSRLVVDVFLLVSIDDEDVVLTARDDARPPSVVPVATLTAKLAALIATISDTIADGVKKGGVLYFFAISSPLC
jgi:hypothetical protein